jgi:hypothetical protein
VWGNKIQGNSRLRATSGPNRRGVQILNINRMPERETLVELPWAADCCLCVEKLRTVFHLLLVSETVRCSWFPW